MICANCSKLAFLKTNKNCIKCQSVIFNNLFVLCDFCSNTEKKCAVCLKNVLLSNKQSRGCGCGGK